MRYNNGSLSFIERLRHKTIMGLDGCWIFDGHLVDGYGKISVGGREVPVHRAAYEAIDSATTDWPPGPAFIPARKLNNGLFVWAFSIPINYVWQPPTECTIAGWVRKRPNG